MKSETPKYQLIVQAMLQRVLSDTGLSDNTLLGSEYDFATAFAASRLTVRKALDYLDAAEVIYRLPGRGVYLKSLANAESYAKHLENSGELAYLPSQRNMLQRDLIRVVFNQPMKELDAPVNGVFEFQMYEELNKYSEKYPCDFSLVEYNELTKEPILSDLCRNGLLWIGAPVSAEPLITQLYQKGVIITLLANGPWPVGINYVFSDEYRAAAEAVEYLFKLGHRNLCYYGKNYSKTSYCRFAGLRHAGRQYGLADNELSIGLFDSINDFPFLKESFWRSSNRPSAILADDHLSAMHILNEGARHGIHFPENCSLISFDDSPKLNILPVPLTAMRQPHQDIVVKGVEQILKRKKNRSCKVENDETLCSRLIVRSSVSYGPCRLRQQNPQDGKQSRMFPHAYSVKI